MSTIKISQILDRMVMSFKFLRKQNTMGYTVSWLTSTTKHGGDMVHLFFFQCTCDKLQMGCYLLSMEKYDIISKACFSDCHCHIQEKAPTDFASQIKHCRASHNNFHLLNCTVFILIEGSSFLLKSMPVMTFVLRLY